MFDVIMEAFLALCGILSLISQTCQPHGINLFDFAFAKEVSVS